MNINLIDYLKNKPIRLNDFHFDIDDILLINEHKIIILEKFRKEKRKYYKLKCLKCGYTYEIQEQRLFRSRGCQCCIGKKLIVGLNDIATTNPELQEIMYDKTDAYKYKAKSLKKIKWVCPDCGEIIEKSIKNVFSIGLNCPNCCDHISFPNKIMYNILSQLNICFEREKYFKELPYTWYDFYIPSENMIIEMDGSIHIQDAFLTLEETMKRDIEKKNMALGIGIDKYINIPAYKSNLKYIKNSILSSDLINYFDFSNIDWEKCYKNSIRSLVKVVADLWNNGFGISEISQKTNLSNTTVNKYLHISKEIGFCDYNQAESRKRGKINKSKYLYICTNNNKTFNTSTEAAIYIGHSSGSKILECCSGKRKTAGKDPKTGEPLKWKRILI